ncbi:MAG: cell filamentation protein Fic [Bacteroidales bacterium]|nr:cell filamentation protein Fic [Bacteroidales bacterium]
MNDSLDNITKADAWQTAIGLQAADRLSTSDYLRQTAQKHIDGKIDIGQVNELINRYYLEMNTQEAGDSESENADKTAVNIARILVNQEKLDFSTEGLSLLHRNIFDGVYENAGMPRQVEETKREWVLGGDSISFLNPEVLPGSLEYSISKENSFQYESASTESLISHLSSFISEIWHLSTFGEGNTRFTAVFTILYLNYLGVDFKFDTFKNDSWYFHNALVRANYRDLVKNIDYEPVYLERFFRNLLLGEQWDLRNRYLHVRPAAEWSVQPKVNSSKRTGQVQVKHNTRKVKEEDKKPTRKIEENYLENPNILFLAVAIGEKFLSVREIMEALGLKGRDNFLKLYLTPALDNKLVTPLYPKSPKHPRQKYLLTQKGLEFLKATGDEMVSRVQRHLSPKSI